jgi:type I restriction enzyme, S subunit
MENKKITIPDGWQEVRLGDVCDVLIGGTPARKTMSYWDKNKDTHNVWVSIADLSKNKFVYIGDSKEYISNEGVKKSNVKLIPKDTVIMSFKLSLGKIAITKKSLYTNEAIAGFIFKKDNLLLTEFLYLVLPSLHYEIDTSIKGKTLNKVKLQNAMICFPPLQEQQKIASILMKVDEEIEKVGEIISKIEDLKKGLMQKLFSKGIGHTKFKDSELGEIPEEWEVRKLGDVCENIQYGYTASSTQEIIGPKLLRITDIQDGNVNWKNVPYCKCDDIEKYKLKIGDIVFARTGATTGKSYKIKNNTDSIFASYLIRVQFDINFINDCFLYQFFQTNIYWKQVNEGTVGGAQGGFNSTKLSNLILPIPSLQEQKQIASILSVVDEKIDVNKKKKDKLVLLKKGLMGDLLSGRVRVR